MPVAVGTFRPPWLPKAPRIEISKPSDDRRGSARERGYTTRWDKARKTFLTRHPLCVCCEANGVVHPAKVVDHIEPHKGDQGKFWNTANWQPLCEWCDKNVKRAVENDWLAGRAARELLNLARIVSGWVHPADRRP